METDIDKDTKAKVQIKLDTLALSARRASASNGLQVASFEHMFDAAEAALWQHWRWKFNRPISAHRVSVMAGEMNAGAWASGSQVRIAQDEHDGMWYVVNGNHTIAAAAKAQRPIVCTVVVDSRPADIAYAFLDTVGSPRTITDRTGSFFDFNGIQFRTNIVRACLIIQDSFKTSGHVYQKYGGSIDVKATAATVQTYEPEWRWILSSVPTKSGACYPLSAVMRHAMLCTLLVALKYHPQLARQWILDAANDDGLARSSPERKLRELMELPGRSNAEKKALYIKTPAILNAKLVGNELRRMPWPNEFPGILGTPYAK